MARPVGSDTNDQPRLRRSKRSNPAPPISNSEPSSPSDSDDSLVITSRKSRRSSEKPKIAKIIKRLTVSDDEAVYLCQTKGSRRAVKLRESELDHASDLLSSFKRSKKLATIVDSDSSDSSSDQLSESTSGSSNHPAPRKSQRLRSQGRSENAQKSRKTDTSAVRRSARSTQPKGKYQLVPELDDEEEYQLEDSSDSPSSVESKPARRLGRTSNRSKSLSQDSPHINHAKTKLKSQIGQRPRDEHQSACAKCSGEFQPNLVELWIRADKIRKPKVRAGSLLDRFRSLEEVYAQGCWVDCSCCTVSYHFGCLPLDMKKSISAQHKKERLEIIAAQNANNEDSTLNPINKDIPIEKKERQPDLKLSIKCPICVKHYGDRCIECGLEKCLRSPKITNTNQVTPKVQSNVTSPTAQEISAPAKVDIEVDDLEDSPPPTDPMDQPLLFRCISCKRATHYMCLPPHGDNYPSDLDEIAEYWQLDWSCKDCNELSKIPVEFILAWRKIVPKSLDSIKSDQPVAQGLGVLRDQPNAKDSTDIDSIKLPDPKDPFEPVEYLCKYEDFCFNDCTWVTHSYLVAKYPQKLRHFLSRGPLLDLKQFSNEGAEDSDDLDSDEDSNEGTALPFNLIPDHDAQLKIPKPWLTPEKILSIEFEDEILIEDLDESDIPTTLEEMYEQMERAYIKWEEQSYHSATWSDKTPKDSPYFPAFMSALENYMKFRKFVVPVVKTEKDLAKLDAPRRQRDFSALEKQPSSIPNQLMDFQLEGLNFCYYNWYCQHPTILADEMGLGKTIQICSLIAVLSHMENRMPFLICVPNSTLGNWARECEKWIPNLKCVPLPGDTDSVEVILQWALFKNGGKRKSQLAAHVVLASYQSAEKNIHILRRVQRWEVVIVDEGQRLKGGPKGGLFRALSSLRVGHKILMTGTPLNNNLRELFNLLSFLNPDKYSESTIDDLELRYEALTPELIDELRAIIRPYMLRRTKETVLELPRLTEIIVPIAMRPLQKQVYRGLLTRNADIITAIYSKGLKKKKATRAGFQNLLMQLRKTLAHPYLNDAQIEPTDVTKVQAHENLVEASGKLVFLQKFIPKLLARGHRMLIFSQFKIYLDVMERFFDGEKLDYLRLDGSTSQLDRQARIDHFNSKNPSCHIFLLTTRAGGAGINLATADTVIMLDPDWNPHSDLQAISRAHRYGQKNPVSVFKLMVKGSAEEKMVQVGKKKLVLDHLVIQKASEQEIEANDVESILQYGAQELLTEPDEALKRDVRYTDEELDDLIQRTAEVAPNAPEDSSQNKTDKSFAFARVWEGRGKELTNIDALEDHNQSYNVEEQRTFWDRILQDNDAQEKAKTQTEVTETGRGYRKRRSVQYNISQPDSNPNSPKKARYDSDSSKEDDGVFLPSDRGENDSSDSDLVEVANSVIDVEELPNDLTAQKDLMRRNARKAQQMANQQVATSTHATLSHPTPDPYTLMHPNSVGYFNHRLPSSGFQAGSSKDLTIGQVSAIQLPDLLSLPNEERMRKMDEILREITLKARLLRQHDLDTIMDTIRSKNQTEQTKELTKAYKFVKRLVAQTHDRSNMAQHQRLHLSMYETSRPAGHQPPMNYNPQQHSHPHRYVSSNAYHSSSAPSVTQATLPPIPTSFTSNTMPKTKLSSIPLRHVSNTQIAMPPSHLPHSISNIPQSLPAPRFTQTNPQTIKPLLAQQTAHLWPKFQSSQQPPASASSSIRHANNTSSHT
ncbi:hypothetical protein O181_026221 [Austropuccinia psidii MF-1]|uniref:Uncharacterized protein n=1 Tax=Austropuccinia psidii MF-1 TaxID=1389203 RepID=A0A9Q3H0A6_9BASI|nr:hypothetical protein [Austropuccinia psidii MF-1]